MRIFSKVIFFLFTLSFINCDSGANGYSITDNYIPCGWMGCGGSDASSINFNEHWDKKAHSGKECIKIDFSRCPQEGTGIYWINSQAAGCNWGDAPGNDFSTAGYTRLTFWARGENGEERIKFGIGGIKQANKLYKDSAEAFQFASLKKGWKKYTLNIGDQKLHSIIGGFFWYASFEDNPEGAVFYLDDIQLQ